MQLIFRMRAKGTKQSVQVDKPCMNTMDGAKPRLAYLPFS
jgi:hypothetical protein